MEGLTITGIHIEMYVDTVHGNDNEAFGDLEYTGKESAGNRRNDQATLDHAAMP